MFFLLKEEKHQTGLMKIWEKDFSAKSKVAIPTIKILSLRLRPALQAAQSFFTEMINIPTAFPPETCIPSLSTLLNDMTRAFGLNKCEKSFSLGTKLNKIKLLEQRCTKRFLLVCSVFILKWVIMSWTLIQQADQIDNNTYGTFWLLAKTCANILLGKEFRCT